MMKSNDCLKKDDKCFKVVFCRYITRNGKRIFPKKAKFFRFEVEVECQSCDGCEDK